MINKQTAVCGTLCQAVELGTMWTTAGPSKHASQLLSDNGGSLSSGERIMFLAAWALWKGRGNLQLAELVEHLDRDNLGKIGALLISLGEGSTAIDAWLSLYSHIV